MYVLVTTVTGDPQTVEIDDSAGQVLVTPGAQSATLVIPASQLVSVAAVPDPGTSSPEPSS